jgi:hypothetical protein
VAVQKQGHAIAYFAINDIYELPEILNVIVVRLSMGFQMVGNQPVALAHASVVQHVNGRIALVEEDPQCLVVPHYVLAETTHHHEGTLIAAAPCDSHVGNVDVRCRARSWPSDVRQEISPLLPRHPRGQRALVRNLVEWTFVNKSDIKEVGITGGTARARDGGSIGGMRAKSGQVCAAADGIAQSTCDGLSSGGVVRATSDAARGLDRGSVSGMRAKAAHVSAAADGVAQ